MKNGYGLTLLIVVGLIAAAVGGYWIGVWKAAGPLSPSATVETPRSGGSEPKPLYYRNPMGLADTSPVPKKDTMGMDYIPVFADDAPGPSGTVKISIEKIQRLGVRTEAASRRVLMQNIRAVGAVQIDERRIVAVSPRYEGWVEKLLVNATGEPVKKGQPLMEIYAPQLLVAEEEYRIARELRTEAIAGNRGTETTALMEQAALRKLRALEAPPSLIERLASGGDIERRIVVPSPATGIILEKIIIQGAKFNAGDTIYRIADIGTVWVLVDVFEQDLQQVRIGQTVELKVTALPGRRFSGKVDYIYPVLSRETRAAKVRIEIPNPDYVLRGDMYASAEFQAPGGLPPVVAVPASAVIDSGVRQIVLVDRGEGRFEPRPVVTGVRGDDYVEIRDGIATGEAVVVSANFLIDAESNLRAALQAFQPLPKGGEPK